MIKRAGSIRSDVPVASIAVALVLLAGIAAPPAEAQFASHPNDLPRLSADGHFPRCTYSELSEVGFPDHMHEWNWPGWAPMVDEDGIAYGPGAFCWRKEIQPREGLVIGDGSMQWGHVSINHNPNYESCDILYFLEIFGWAEQTVPELLGLAYQDTLHVFSPDNIGAYRKMTGYDVWRLYRLESDACIIEPLPVLQGRTLEGHALFSLMTEWLLKKAIPSELPPWLLYGLSQYIGENGIHLVNYMAQFRPSGPILLSPPLIDSILAGAPNPDLEKDREMYRRASYCAYLMVWELVENQGGMDALRDFLGNLAEGLPLDEAGRLVYGMEMQDLAATLDPANLGEPIGKAVQSRSPHLPPQ
jgi:hypothetical protein